MKLALIVFGILIILELVIWVRPVWKYRKFLAGSLVLLLACDNGLIVGNDHALWAFLILFFSLYRVVNLLRLVEGRTQADYLYSVSRKCSWLLIAFQAVILLLAYYARHSNFSVNRTGLAVLVFAQFLTILVLLGSTLRHIKTTRAVLPSENYATRDLPSLSVAIPARNETIDLEKCLESLVASTYPKLEILVLDDCSQNKRTPEIIREYAHSGVIFVDGKVAPDNWLAKNYAYQQLAEAASGELLLFCGVDTRFSPDSIKIMVESLLSKKKAMLSILPRNKLPSFSAFGSLLVQPSRYYWELALPRRWLNRPPVLSTCWLITRAHLEEAGWFKAITRSVSIESYFARYCASHGDSYSFMQSGKAFGLNSAKSFAEQRSTAIRTRYPQLHRRPEFVGLLSLAEVTVLFMPYLLAISAIWTHSSLIFYTSLINICLSTLAYTKIVDLTYQKFLFRSLWALPFACVYDVLLLNYSMWQYEFREVIWKERNICLPVMHVSEALPKLK